MSSRNERAREIQESIRLVLINNWDPIGVNDVPEAQDEYDSYVGGIYRLLSSGASEVDIAQHLFKIESETMGLACAGPNQLLGVAKELRRLNISLE